MEICKISKAVKHTFRSKYRTNKSGVPQGSILGPLLFLLYINDLPNILKHQCILFADDTTIIVKCQDKSSFEDNINNTVKQVINWLNHNNLQINLSKTKMIQFKTYQSESIPLKINYCNEKVEEVDDTKFLGIMLDKNCNWKAHIIHVCNKLDRFVYALKRLRQVSSIQTALCAYHGYVASTLKYAVILWGNSVDVEKAFKIQKKV